MNGKRARLLRNKARELADNFGPIVQERVGNKIGFRGQSIMRYAYPLGHWKRIYRDLKRRPLL